MDDVDAMTVDELRAEVRRLRAEVAGFADVPCDMCGITKNEWAATELQGSDQAEDPDAIGGYHGDPDCAPVTRLWAGFPIESEEK